MKNKGPGPRDFLGRLFYEMSGIESEKKCNCRKRPVVSDAAAAAFPDWLRCLSNQCWLISVSPKLKWLHVSLLRQSTMAHARVSWKKNPPSNHVPTRCWTTHFGEWRRLSNWKISLVVFFKIQLTCRANLNIRKYWIKCAASPGSLILPGNFFPCRYVLYLFF